MYSLFHAVVPIFLFLASTTNTQVPAGKDKPIQGRFGPNIEDRFPDDVSPAIRAILKQHVDVLRSSKNKPEDRVRSAATLGELDSRGRPASRFLCEAMVDKNIDVRTAAADALKRVDPENHKFAVKLVLEQRKAQISDFAAKKLDAEPLTPILIYFMYDAAKFPSPQEKNGVWEVKDGIRVLCKIAPEDLDACKLIISTFVNKNAAARNAAIQAACEMKHKKLALPGILAIFKAEPDNIIAIRALADLADESTSSDIEKHISTQRYHKNQSVREEVEKALDVLKLKK